MRSPAGACASPPPRVQGNRTYRLDLARGLLRSLDRELCGLDSCLIRHLGRCLGRCFGRCLGRGGLALRRASIPWKHGLQVRLFTLAGATGVGLMFLFVGRGLGRAGGASSSASDVSCGKASTPCIHGTQVRSSTLAGASGVGLTFLLTGRVLGSAGGASSSASDVSVSIFLFLPCA